MFILFVYLSRAFDMAIREFRIGFKHGFDGDKLEHLYNLGLSADDAKTLLAELDAQGCFFNSLGINSGITEIIKSLHTNNWFRFAESDSIIVSDRGGRQGCKLGGIMFNFLYARSLHKLRLALREHGMDRAVPRNGEVDLLLPHFAHEAAAVSNANDAQTLLRDRLAISCNADACLPKLVQFCACRCYVIVHAQLLTRHAEHRHTQA